jgi:hypothetical protein
MLGADTAAMRRSATRMAAGADNVSSSAARARLAVDSWRWSGPDAVAHLQAARSSLASALAVAADLDRLADDVRRQASEQDRVSR